MRYRVALAVVASAAVLITAACGGGVGDSDTDDVIPAGFNFILKINVADILNDPDVAAIYGEVPKDEDDPQTLDELLNGLDDGLGIVRQMEEVLVFGDLSDFDDSAGVVARGVFQEEAVIASVGQGENPLPPTDYKGRTIYTFEDEDVAFTLMDDLLVVAPVVDIIRRVIDVHQGDAEPASGPVYDAFTSVGDPLFRLAAALPEDALEDLDFPFGEEGEGVGFVGDIQIITVVADKKGSDYQATAVVDFGSESSATDARDAIDAVLTLARLAAPGDEVEALLKTLDLSVSGRRLTAEIEVSVSKLNDLARSLDDPTGGLGGLFGIASQTTIQAEPEVLLERAIRVHPGTPEVAVIAPPAVSGGKSVPVMVNAEHRPEGESIDYGNGTLPPTSGPHWSRWADCGFHSEEIADEMIVHNMEHGHVIISYNVDPGLAPVMEMMTQRLDDFDSFGVMRPYSKIGPGTVTMTAWGYIDHVPGIDTERIAAFYNQHHANRYSEETREAGPIPCR